MMDLTFRNRDGSSVDSTWVHKWSDLAKSENIDVTKFISYLLLLSTDTEKESIEAFNACMYMLSVILNCDGRLIFSARDMASLEASNNELAIELAPGDDADVPNGTSCDPLIETT